MEWVTDTSEIWIIFPVTSRPFIELENFYNSANLPAQLCHYLSERWLAQWLFSLTTRAILPVLMLLFSMLARSVNQAPLLDMPYAMKAAMEIKKVITNKRFIITSYETRNGSTSGHAELFVRILNPLCIKPKT